MELTLADLQDISYKKGFNIELLEKDYLLTHLLYLLKDIDGIYFKGGTALHKILLNHKRLSEDLDFTLTRSLPQIEKAITEKLKGTLLFGEITHDKKVDKFTRLVVHYKLFHEKGTIFIDLNERGKLLLKPEKHTIVHFYPDLPPFSINTVHENEMVAEKMAATMGRNRPRDHFDVYCIINENIPIDLKLVEQKCKDSEDEFSIIKMFNKAKKLKKRWDEDMINLLAEEIPFQKVMKTLAKHFKYTEEKERLKITIK